MSAQEHNFVVRKYIVSTSSHRESLPDEVRSALKSIDALAEACSIPTVWEESAVDSNEKETAQSMVGQLVLS